MNLHDALLDQAQQLTRWDPRRPRQVNLRRAVSSAGYALFHMLSAETSALFAIESDLAARINRTLNHGDMKKSSTMIGNDKLPKCLQPHSGGGHTTPADLKTVTSTFIKLQEARHIADDDLTKTFRRQEVLDYIQLASDAFDAWRRIRKTDDARIDLASFLLWKRWDEDSRRRRSRCGPFGGRFRRVTTCRSTCRHWRCRPCSRRTHPGDTDQPDEINQLLPPRNSCTV